VALPQFPGQAPSSVILDNSKGLAAGWSSLLAPNFSSALRYGFTRAGHEETGAQDAPFVSFRGISTLGATTTGLTAIVPVHQVEEDLFWSKRQHEIRFGGVVRLIRNRTVDFKPSFPSGSVVFGWLLDAGASVQPPDVGAAFRPAFRTAAIDLLGPVTYTNVTYNYTTSGQLLPFGTPKPRTFGQEEYNAYAADTWRVSKALTITAGLLYSLAPPVYETHGYQVSPMTNLGEWFATRAMLADTGRSQALAGPLSFALANSAAGRPLYESQNRNFSPRLAIAWSPQASSGLSKLLFGGPGKTSVRAGGGIFYDLFGMSLARSFDSSAPGLSREFQSSPTSLSAAARFTGYHQIPAGSLPPAPPGGFPYTPPATGDYSFALASSIDQNIKQPYAINLNFSIGREFDGGLFVQGSYVGRLSRRSLLITDLTQPTNLRDPKSGITYWQAVNELAAAARAGQPTSQIKPNAFWEQLYPQFQSQGLTATQAVYEQVITSFPTDITTGLALIDEFCLPGCGALGPNAMFNAQYAALYAYRSLGSGSFHSMQISVRKRFSGGLLFDLNYSLARSIDLTSAAENEFPRLGTGENAR
jgi:hypothetical protein